MRRRGAKADSAVLLAAESAEDFEWLNTFEKILIIRRSSRRGARADSAVLLAAESAEDFEWLNTFEKIQRNATLNANCNEVVEPIQFKPGGKSEEVGGELNTSLYSPFLAVQNSSIGDLVTD